MTNPSLNDFPNTCDKGSKLLIWPSTHVYSQFQSSCNAQCLAPPTTRSHDCLASVGPWWQPYWPRFSKIVLAQSTDNTTYLWLKIGPVYASDQQKSPQTKKLGNAKPPLPEFSKAFCADTMRRTLRNCAQPAHVQIISFFRNITLKDVLQSIE